jgi:hypothetical protein
VYGHSVAGVRHTSLNRTLVRVAAPPITLIGSNGLPLVTLPGVVARAVCAILVVGGWVWLAPFVENHTVG